VVTDPSGAAPFAIDPAPFDETLRLALAQERRLAAGSAR
jgi:hypothetical protein